MRTRTYGGVGGRKTKVGRKLTFLFSSYPISHFRNVLIIMAQRKFPVDFAFPSTKTVIFMDGCTLISTPIHEKAHFYGWKAQSRRSKPLGLACAACFEQLACVFASCGALYALRLGRIKRIFGPPMSSEVKIL